MTEEPGVSYDELRHERDWSEGLIRAEGQDAPSKKGWGDNQ